MRSPFHYDLVALQDIDVKSLMLRRTESYDDLLPVGQDPRWDIFADLHSYLETTFPLV